MGTSDNSRPPRQSSRKEGEYISTSYDPSIFFSSLFLPTQSPISIAEQYNSQTQVSSNIVHQPLSVLEILLTISHQHTSIYPVRLGTWEQVAQSESRILSDHDESHHGSRYFLKDNSRCTRMTGVRTGPLFPPSENDEPGRSEIILSKLDLDNTSERTCVALIPSFCLGCCHR